MRQLFVTFALLISISSYSQKTTRLRSTHNPEDRKYFNHKLDSLFRHVHWEKNIDMMSDKDLALLDKEIELDIELEPEPYKQLRQQMDKGAHVIAGYLFAGVLVEFPQFERFILTLPSKEGKKVKITFFLFDDHSIGFYNETEKHWCKIPYPLPAK